MSEIDHIEIVPDSFGWSIRIYTDAINFERHDIGDVIQFTEEVDRTLGKWLADGPADFHASAPYDRETDDVLIADLAADRAAFRTWMDSFKTPRRK